MARINSLPDHILIDIFGYLSHKMIEKCSLVCKRWDDLISNSKEIMEKFILCIDEGEDKKAMEVRRRHQTVVVSDLNAVSLDAICLHNLRHLEFKNIQGAVESSIFLNMLNKLPQLQSLYAYIKITGDVPNDQKVQLDLEKLHCYINILRLLDVKSLKKFELDCDAQLSSHGFFDFLKKQKNLQELIIMGKYSHEFFQNPEIFEIECRLTHFHFSCHEAVNQGQYIKFLHWQQESLKSLHMQGSGKKYEIVVKFALENLTSLKHLATSFSLTFLFSDRAALESGLSEALQNLQISHEESSPRKKITTNIESLITTISDELSNNKLLFDAFQNLKHLNLQQFAMDEDSLRNNFLYIGATLQKLETLKIREIGSSKICFPKLKELTVDYISFHSNPKVFNNFIRRHSNTLEKVEIQREEIDQGTVDILLSCQNLKHLVVLSETDCFKMFNAFSLRTRPFTLLAKYMGGPIRFKFPDDKRIWYSFYKFFSAQTVR